MPADTELEDRKRLGVFLLDGAVVALLAVTLRWPVNLLVGGAICGSIAVLAFLVVDVPPDYVFAFPTGVSSSLAFLIAGPGTIPYVVVGWVAALFPQYFLWRKGLFCPPTRVLRAVERASPRYALAVFVGSGAEVLLYWAAGMVAGTPLYVLCGGRFPAPVDSSADLGAIVALLLAISLVWLGLCEARAALEPAEAYPRNFTLFARSLLTVFVPMPGTVLVLFALEQYYERGIAAMVLWAGASVPLLYGVKSLLRENSRYLKVQQEIDRHRQAVMLAGHTSMIIHEVLHEIGTLNLLLHLCESELRQCVAQTQGVAPTLAQMRQVVRHLEQMVGHFRVCLRRQGIQEEPLRIGELAAGAIDSLASGGEQTANIRYEDGIAGSTLVMGDELLLKNALVNVLRNACEASPAGAAIEVGVTRDEAGKEVRIVVTDHGGGIVTDDLRQIFSPSFTTKDKGLGLGLYLAREIIEAHRGRLTVASRPGRGTVVTMAVPMLHDGNHY